MKSKVAILASLCCITLNLALGLHAAEEKGAEDAVLLESNFIQTLNEKFSKTSYPHLNDKWFSTAAFNHHWLEFQAAATAALDAGMNPNIILTKKFYYPTTLLTLSVGLAYQSKERQLLENLIKKKADFTFIKGGENQQESVLIKAGIKSGDDDSLKLIQLLLDNGADPQQIGDSGLSPIHFFAQFTDCSINILKLFLEHLRPKGINTNIRDKELGFTPVMIIANSSYSLDDWTKVEAKLDLLLDYGADLSLLDASGRDLHKIISNARCDNSDLQYIRQKMHDWVTEKMARQI